LLCVCAKPYTDDVRSAPPDPSKKSTASLNSDDSLKLTWTPRIDAASGALHFDYRIENPGAQDVWVLDLLLSFRVSAYALNPEETLVREEAAHPGRVLLTRGYVQAEKVLPQFELRPVARRLAAGAAVEGRGRASWPLRNHHPDEHEDEPLAHAAREAVLEVGVMPIQPELLTLTIAGGETASVPRPADASRFQRFIRSEAFPLSATPTPK